MPILANPDYFQKEADGEVEQVLVAVKFVGDNRHYSNNAVVNQGRFPDRMTFIQGQWYVGFVPEETPDYDEGTGIAWFERSGDFEVVFDPEEIAEILLSYNYVDLDPAGPIGDGDTLPGYHAKVADALDLEDEIEAGMTHEEQLREMANLDDDAGPEAQDPVDALVYNHDRGELKELVKEHREDASEFSLRGASMEDMAEFLVETEEGS